MRTLLKLLLVLVVLAAIAVVGYALVGDLSPEQQDVIEPVILNGG
ncbi:MAG: hypothetical protein AAF626_18110 [Pseudomonadota bacterium]